MHCRTERAPPRALQSKATSKAIGQWVQEAEARRRTDSDTRRVKDLPRWEGVARPRAEAPTAPGTCTAEARIPAAPIQARPITSEAQQNQRY